MRKIFAVLAALICCLSAWTSVPAAQAFTLDKEDGEPEAEKSVYPVL